MKELVKLVLPMILVVFIASLLLSFTYGLTKPIIDEREKVRTENMLKELFPELDSYSEIENGYLIMVDGEEVGKAIISSAYGYSSEIKLLVGKTDDKIAGIRIIYQEETPGLGARITEPEFYKQFDDKEVGEIKLTKDGGEIDAVTSATISSSAVVEAVNNAR